MTNTVTLYIMIGVIMITFSLPFILEKLGIDVDLIFDDEFGLTVNTKDLED